MHFKVEELAMLPVPLTVKWQDGTEETFHLPKLGVEDFIPMLTQETARRKEAGRKAIAKANIRNPKDLMFAERVVELDEATIPDLNQRVQAPAGIKAVVFASMQKAKIPSDKHEKIWAILPSYLQHTLSGELSTLFIPPEPEKPTTTEGGAGDKPDPFASQASGSATDSAKTSSAT